jgi:hypothetical protein
MVLESSHVPPLSSAVDGATDSSRRAPVVIRARCSRFSGGGATRPTAPAKIARQQLRRRAILRICIRVQKILLRRKYKPADPHASERKTKGMLQNTERLLSDNRQDEARRMSVLSRASNAPNSSCPRDSTMLRALAIANFSRQTGTRLVLETCAPLSAAQRDSRMLEQADVADGPMGERLLIFATAALMAAAMAGCASNAQADAYNAFLERIANECKPLIIGSDNLGQAIVFNGLGASPENYNNFLGKTSALYHGSISPQIYRESLTTFLGGGTYNQRSFDCIVAHLPASTK